MDAASSEPTHKAAQPQAGARYATMAQALHWLTAALVFATLALAWVMYNMPDNAPTRGLLFTLHKSFGITIFALVVARLIWRARHGVPDLKAPAWMRAAAAASHGLLYLTLLALPLSGYIMSAATGRPISFFGVLDLPGFAEKTESTMDAAFLAHVGFLQWALYALLLLHVGAAIWHEAVRRDGALERMLPAQRDGAPTMPPKS